MISPQSNSRTKPKIILHFDTTMSSILVKIGLQPPSGPKFWKISKKNFLKIFLTLNGHAPFLRTRDRWRHSNACSLANNCLTENLKYVLESSWYKEHDKRIKKTGFSHMFMLKILILLFKLDFGGVAENFFEKNFFSEIAQILKFWVVK